MTLRDETDAFFAALRFMTRLPVPAHVGHGGAGLDRASRYFPAVGVVVGAIAALVAAYVGFNAEPTIEGTSVATTRAVVNASLLVLMFNFVISALLFN